LTLDLNPPLILFADIEIFIGLCVEIEHLIFYHISS